MSMENRTKILFYTSVKELSLIKITGFYATDINILEDLDYRVKITNSYLEFFKFWNYDIAFIYFWSKGLLPAFISRIFFKKVMFTGGIDRLDKKYNKSKFDYWIRAIIFKLCTTLSNANIIVSKSDYKNITLTGFRFKNTYTIPHVIDFDKYQYKNTGKENFITTVAWMEDAENVKRKGVDILVYSFKNFLKINPNFRLKIIGSLGEGSDYLKNIAKKLEVIDKIDFTGRISEHEKVNLLKKSKYYFQLSLYEGFGIAAIEAMAAGNIVIHSGRGGLSDGISDCGIIINDLNNYNEIALKLNEIDKNYRDYEEFIIKGINHVKNNFGYKVRKNGFESILKVM